MYPVSLAATAVPTVHRLRHFAALARPLTAFPRLLTPAAQCPSARVVF